MPAGKKSVSLSSRMIKSPIFDMREWKPRRSSCLYGILAMMQDCIQISGCIFLLFFSHIGRLAMPIIPEKPKEVPTFLIY